MNHSQPIPLALVTGAAHRLGRAVALELARQGYALGLHYNRSVEEAHRTAEELSRAGSPVFLLQADLLDPPQIETLFAEVAGLPHPLQVLVNSAGVMTHGSLLNMPASEWDATMDLNLRAPWLCARAAAPLMEAGGGGAVVNISDSGAQKTWMGYPAYIISKAGLETLTRLLARALAPLIRVNAVAPGLILPAPDMPVEQWQRLVDRLPLKRTGSPEDVARAVMFFIQNPYITGQILAVDGGYQMV